MTFSRTDDILQSLEGAYAPNEVKEHFSSSMTDTISEAVADARGQVMFNPSIAAVNRNRELIRILYEKGIFHIKDSVVQVAKALGISRNTVYLHLRGSRQRQVRRFVRPAFCQMLG